MICEKKEVKWLVVADSKQREKALKEALHNDAAYLDAEHKRRENWEKLISKSRFEARALITTAVQDNGINVWDDSVRNLVVMTDIRPSEG